MKNLHPAHEFLIELGYSHSRIPEECYDSGDGESGPMISYQPAYDEYELDNETVYLYDDGKAGRDVWCQVSGYPLESNF